MTILDRDRKFIYDIIWTDFKKKRISSEINCLDKIIIIRFSVEKTMSSDFFE